MKAKFTQMQTFFKKSVYYNINFKKSDNYWAEWAIVHSIRYVQFDLCQRNCLLKAKSNFA